MVGIQSCCCCYSEVAEGVYQRERQRGVLTSSGNGVLHVNRWLMASKPEASFGAFSCRHARHRTQGENNNKTCGV